MNIVNEIKITSVIIYGGTGQAKVVRPIIEQQGGNVVAIFDDTNDLVSPFEDIPIYYGFNSLKEWAKSNDVDNIGFVVCIGNPNGGARYQLSKKISRLGFTPYSVVDQNSIISNNCIIGKGVQIMAGAIIMPDVKIGEQCIINTKASIDHECVINNGCEVGPGATLCGCIDMKFNSWICAGATIIPRCTIGENSIVGAGAVVMNDIDDNTVVAGVPAKKIKDI